jgi:hypothetical protein
VPDINRSSGNAVNGIASYHLLSLPVSGCPATVTFIEQASPPISVHQAADQPSSNSGTGYVFLS